MMRVSKQNFIDASTVITAVTLAASGTDFWFAGAVVCARTIDYLLDKKSVSTQFAPPEQLHRLIGFLATRYDTFCFGDTWHTSPYFFKLITHENFQDGLDSVNARPFFVEIPIRFRESISDLESGKITADQFMQRWNRMTSSGSKSSHILDGNLLGSAIKRSPGKFRAGDMREFSKLISKSTFRIAGTINTIVQIFFPNRFPHVFGRVAALAISGLVRKKVDIKLVDDRKTVENMIEHVPIGAPFSVGFGDGHFVGTAAELGGEDMVSILQNHGRRPVVINVFSSAKRQATDRKRTRPSDIDLVMGENGKPGVIMFRNRELAEEYTSAIRQGLTSNVIGGNLPRDLR